MACVNGSVHERHRLCHGNQGAAVAYNRAAKAGLTKVVDCTWAEGKTYMGQPFGDGSCVAEYL